MILCIGGSSSTGSSLLLQLLNRHKKIIGGPESSLFARPQFYNDWNKYKGRINTSQFSFLRNHGWHRDNGVNIPYQKLGISYVELKDLILKQTSFEKFLLELTSIINANNNTLWWAEKTPANSLLFHQHLQMEIPLTCILTIRDPFEAIASMVIRGFSPVYATALFLINTGFGIVSSKDHFMSIKYEDLTSAYELTCSAIAKFLGLDDNFDWHQIVVPIKMNSWRFAETDLPYSSKESRFDVLSSEEKNLILYCTNRFRIKNNYTIAGREPSVKSVNEICDLFGYKMRGEKRNMQNIARRDLLQEMVIRTMKLHPTHLFNFPIRLE